MGGGLFLLVGPRGRPDGRIRTVWSSLRGRCPVELERELRAHYRRLLEAPGPQRVELVESLFRAEARAVMLRPSASAVAARLRSLLARYAEAGFQPGVAGIPPDHVTVQLHFLGHLGQPPRHAAYEQGICVNPPPSVP